YRRAWSAEELLAYAYGEEADFLPGRGWAYSNTNYILLDLIVAQISGTSLATEMRRLVFTPLGMQNTFMEIIEPRDVGFGGLLVRGYDYGEDITQINDALGFGDGGLISNAQDLATFLSAMFLEKSLLSKNSLIQMLKFDPIGNYGLGISLTETDFGISWEHSGSTAGFMGDMIYLPDEQTIFVLLTNDFNSELKEPVFNASLQIVLD
ncbi:MAG: beta-lactamase family protein, partial [Devosiaceae bacterium]|nr:beta-lactamase family protein [Devosiaceae bacterium]